jgi:phosphoribosylformylglycinamidine cyclo-ligase
MAVLTARHVPSFVLGTVEKARHDQPRAQLSGDHPRF